MRKILPLCAAVALIIPCFTISSARAAEPSEFVRQANQINLEEIELGHYAAEHGVGHEIRDYGSHLADDHSEASDKLHHIAEHLDMHLRNHLDKEHQAKVDHLEHLHGMEFDRAFLHAMMDGHEQAIHIFEEASHHAQHRELRQYASDELPHLHHHLDKAHELADHPDHSDHPDHRR